MATDLVVDDDSGVRKLAHFILEQSGQVVLTASNGVEALIIYTSYRSRLDVVLTDVNMPQMEELNSQRVSIPWIPRKGLY